MYPKCYRIFVDKTSDVLGTKQDFLSKESEPIRAYVYSDFLYYIVSSTSSVENCSSDSGLALRKNAKLCSR